MSLFFLALVLIIIGVLVAWNRYSVYFYAWQFEFPNPKFAVTIDKNIMIPMPDGTKLATDIYRPKSHDKYPVIIVRTPYNKRGYLQPYKPLGLLYASQGYVVVVQDVRGKYGSEGEFYPYAYEALDGHTTVMWAGEASWSNGKVALVGLSYPGTCAWLAARYKSPYLRTIISMFTAQNTYSIWIDNGIPFLKGPLSWLLKYTGKKENTHVTDEKLENVLWKLPVVNQDEHAVNHKISFYKEYLAHIQPDSFWEEISAHQDAGNLDIAAYIVGGWYDPFLRGTIEDYTRMIQAPATSKNHYSRLVIGPWSHNPIQEFKGVDLGKDASFKSTLTSILDWFDIWLKERKRPTRALSKIRYFVMGKNVWKEADQWPPANLIEKKLYLKNSSQEHEKGILSDTLATESQQNHYIYNPRDPVLFRGGAMMRSPDIWVTPIEQEEIIARDDVLTYHSDLIHEELYLVGSAKLILYVSSSAFDTDFCAKICDVYPNGKTYNLATGFVRMRFRHGVENPEPIIPGKIYRIQITLKEVAHAFLKGHRILLQITSSDFPVHNRNLNTGMSCETSVEINEAEQIIYTGGAHDSHLLLPILD